MRLGLVGGRGYVGEELLRLLLPHPVLQPVFVTSRSQAGLSLNSAFAGLPATNLKFSSVEPAQAAAEPLDVLVLALGNGEAARWVAAFDQAGHPAQILDISADYRHDKGWVYGLTELKRSALAGASRVANPGCYATASMLALWPLRQMLAQPPALFGVSGYSGAGRTPSPRNNPDRLADNLIPYHLTGHGHEAEVSHQLGHPVRFMPHVAAYFRGLSVTAAVSLAKPVDLDGVRALFAKSYAQCPLIELSNEPPETAQVRASPRARVGGWAVDARDAHHLVLVSVIDNLGKGAATQALQNLNLMCGLDELEGLTHD